MKIKKAKLKYVGAIQPNKTMKDYKDFDEFEDMLLKNMKNIPEEYAKIINENFWKIVNKKDGGK